MSHSDEEDDSRRNPTGAFSGQAEDMLDSQGYDSQPVEMDMEGDSDNNDNNNNSINNNDDVGQDDGDADYDVPPPPLPLSHPPLSARRSSGTAEGEDDRRDNHGRHHHHDDADHDDDYHHRRRRERDSDQLQDRRCSPRSAANEVDELLSNHDARRDDENDDRYSRDSRPDYDKTTNHPTNIIYVANIPYSATIEQMRTLFGFLGDIVDIVMYHYNISPEKNFKVCFIKYAHHSSVLMAQHLTNTVFIDRALFVLPYKRLGIPPSQEIATKLGYGDTEYVSRLNAGFTTQVTTGPAGAQIITTSDPLLTSHQLQAYPQLPVHTDPTRIEEIRRTLYIGNLDSSLAPEEVIQFFNDIGEVKYIRIAGDETQPTRFAFVEFTHQASIVEALKKNGFILGSRALKMNHSNNPILKPPIKLDINDPLKKRDRRSRSRDFDGRESTKHRSSSRRDRSRDRPRGYDRRRQDGRRASPRSGSRRSRSRDKSRRSRSRDHSRRSKSRDDLIRRRSRSRESPSRKRDSRSRSIERKWGRKSSRRW